MPYRVTPHAAEEMRRRDISAEQLDETLQSPEQVVPAQNGRKIGQRRFVIDSSHYLIRVVVEEGSNETVVVTVYRTSKIEKYWSTT